MKKATKRDPTWVDPNAGSKNIRVLDATFERLHNFPVTYKMTMDNIVTDLLDCWKALEISGKDPKEMIAEMKKNALEKVTDL